MVHSRSAFEFHHVFINAFEFSWCITGLILKALSVLWSFLLSAKCRFWRISQKRFRIIVFWIPLLPIRLSTLQYSAIVGNLLIAITKFIPRNAFSSSLVTVKFLPFWWAYRFNCSTINSSSSSRPVTKENIPIGETFSFRLDSISGTRWHSSCLVTFTFLVCFHYSSFLFFSFFFHCWSLGTTWRLASGVVKNVLFTSCLYNFFFSYELSVRIIH